MQTGKRICALALALALLVLCGCGAAKPAEPRGKVYYSWFDTVSYVYSYAGDSAERFNGRSAEVSHILEDYHRLFDIYHEYAGINNLCTLNRLAGGEALELDARLIEFLLYARDMYELTEGRMNVMLGSVLALWHDCREAAAADPAAAAIPDGDALRAAAAHTDISLLEIDPIAGTARISDPEARIDVGALGKGYATEMAARALEDEGVTAYVLNIGGNIRILGDKSDGSGWVTGIRDPQAPDEGFALRLRLRDTACVTSGVYERYFTVDGERYHHIIDPETLCPAAYFSSLTVVTRDSGLADALSTALFCLPLGQGMALVESLDGVEAVWIDHEGNISLSSGAEELILQD